MAVGKHLELNKRACFFSSTHLANSRHSWKKTILTDKLQGNVAVLSVETILKLPIENCKKFMFDSCGA